LSEILSRTEDASQGARDPLAGRKRGLQATITAEVIRELDELIGPCTADTLDLEAIEAPAVSTDSLLVLEKRKRPPGARRALEFRIGR
jgi:hypothetical protein